MCPLLVAAALSLFPPRVLSVPAFRQSTDYTCAPAVGRTLTALYGGTISEAEAARGMGTTEAYGTNLESLARWLARRGIPTRPRSGMTMKELRSEVARGKPVVVLAQAWDDRPFPRDYGKVWDSGHFQLVVGVDEAYVYLMDPMLSPHERGRLPHAEFLRRWHGLDGHPRATAGRGMALVPRLAPPSPRWETRRRFSEIP